MPDAMQGTVANFNSRKKATNYELLKRYMHALSQRHDGHYSVAIGGSLAIFASLLQNEAQNDDDDRGALVVLAGIALVEKFQIQTLCIIVFAM